MEKKVCLFVRKILREMRRVEKGGGGKQCEDWVTIISSSLSDIVISIFPFYHHSSSPGLRFSTIGNVQEDEGNEREGISASLSGGGWSLFRSSMIFFLDSCNRFFNCDVGFTMISSIIKSIYQWKDFIS